MVTNITTASKTGFQYDENLNLFICGWCGGYTNKLVKFDSDWICDECKKVHLEYSGDCEESDG